VVAFALRGWDAEEAGALLGEAFGIAVESRCLTAAPLPFPERLGAGFLRASLASCSTVGEVYALVDAVSRLACRRPAAGCAH
jgi:selenocysteine lyase/cysteine desulfurase